MVQRTLCMKGFTLCMKGKNRFFNYYGRRFHHIKIYSKQDKNLSFYPAHNKAASDEKSREVFHGSQ